MGFIGTLQKKGGVLIKKPYYGIYRDPTKKGRGSHKKNPTMGFIGTLQKEVGSGGIRSTPPTLDLLTPQSHAGPGQELRKHDP